MKRLFVSVCVVAVLLSVIGCSFSISLAEGFDKTEVENIAKEVVGIINRQDYESVVSLLRSDLQGRVTPEQLKEGWGTKLTEVGSFADYQSVSVVGQKDQNTKEDYAVAVLVCRYANGNATFTLSFDCDLVLVGLYMR